MTIDDPEVVREGEAVFGRYEAALGANDVETLDALFWDAPQAVRYGIAENLHGAEEIRAWRRRRPGAPPPRAVIRQVITAYGDDVATVDISFRPQGSDRIGRQSQTWIRLPEGWRIATAHISWLQQG